MRAIIVDDERAMLTIMELHLMKIDELEVAGSFQHAAEALDFIKRKGADIAFVDINIGGESGLELARAMRNVRPAMEIVFVTSHKQFALDAFNVYPLDYMVKPISMARMKETILRAKKKTESFDHAAANTLYVRILGTFEVSSSHLGKVKWISKKSQEVFAYLLMHRGKNVSRSRIVEDVFQEMPLQNAQSYLNTAVYQLRKALSIHGMKAFVVSNNEHYSLELNSFDIDLIEFEKRAHALSEIGDWNAEEAIYVERLYGGDLFGDRSYVWSIAERERLGQLYEDVAKRLMHWLSSQRRFREAIQIAKKLLERNELDEELHIHLLRIYAAMNDRNAYRNHYERTIALFRQEYDIFPEEELNRLYDIFRK